MLKDYFRQPEDDGVHHLSTAELRQRAAAILKSGRGLDGIDEVSRILRIIRDRHQQGTRTDGGVSTISQMSEDARYPQR